MKKENNTQSPPKPKKKVTFFRKPIKPRLKSEVKDFKTFNADEHFKDEWNLDEDNHNVSVDM